MDITVWGGLAIAGLLAAIVGTRLVSHWLTPGSRDHQEQANPESTIEAEILTRGKGTFV